MEREDERRSSQYSRELSKVRLQFLLLLKRLLNTALRCIDLLESFFQPILDGVCTLTGGTVTVIWGGPEPKDQGHLNIVQ